MANVTSKGQVSEYTTARLQCFSRSFRLNSPLDIQDGTSSGGGLGIGGIVAIVVIAVLLIVAIGICDPMDDMSFIASFVAKCQFWFSFVVAVVIYNTSRRSSVTKSTDSSKISTPNPAFI